MNSEIQTPSSNFSKQQGTNESDMSGLPGKRYYKFSDFYITGSEINCPISLTRTALSSCKACSSRLFILYFEGRFIIPGQLGKFKQNPSRKVNNSDYGIQDILCFGKDKK